MSLEKILEESKKIKPPTNEEKKKFYESLDKEIKKIFTLDFFQKASREKKTSVLHTLERPTIPYCSNYTKHVVNLMDEIFPGNPFGVKCVLINTSNEPKLVIRVSW